MSNIDYSFLGYLNVCSTVPHSNEGNQISLFFSQNNEIWEHNAFVFTLLMVFCAKRHPSENGNCLADIHDLLNAVLSECLTLNRH